MQTGVIIGIAAVCGLGVVFIGSILALKLYHIRIKRRNRLSNRHVENTGRATVSQIASAPWNNPLRMLRRAGSIVTVPDYSEDPKDDEMKLAEGEEHVEVTAFIDPDTHGQPGTPGTDEVDFTEEAPPYVAHPSPSHHGRTSFSELSLAPTRTSSILSPHDENNPSRLSRFANASRHLFAPQPDSSLLRMQTASNSRRRSSTVNTRSSLLGSTLEHPGGVNASRISLAETPISRPLEGSFIRSSFTYPKNGMTPAQMSFLSSMESLNIIPGRLSNVGTEPPAFEDVPLPPSPLPVTNTSTVAS